MQGFAPCLIPPDRPTVASFLQEQGYHTGIIGKRHLNFQYTDPKTGENLVDKKTKSQPLLALKSRTAPSPEVSTTSMASITLAL